MVLSREAIALCVSDLIKPAWPCSSAGHRWGWLVPPHKVSSRESTSATQAGIKSLLVPLLSGESNPLKTKLDLGFGLLFVLLSLVPLPHQTVAVGRVRVILPSMMYEV